MKKKHLKTLGVATAILSVGLISTTSLSTVFAQTSVPSEKPIKGIHKMVAPELFKNVERKVENLPNGIKMIMTSTDLATVTKLQTMPEHPARKDDKVTVTKTNLSNGVEVSVTSTDTEVVKKLQEREKFHGEFLGAKEIKQGKMFGKNVERKTENLPDGIKITMVSSDAATVTKLQTMPEHPAPKNDKVSITRNNISNGVEITIISADSEVVKKLQEGPQFHKMKGQATGLINL